MTREQAREFINGRLSVELKKAPKRISGHDTFICPLCSNGSGEDGTGISTKDGKHYTCFRGCFTNFDYLDILKQQHGTDSETDIFKRYNLTIDNSDTVKPAPSAATTPKPEPKIEQPQQDYTNFFLQAKKDFKDSTAAIDYLKMRGISAETALRYSVGYVSDWKSPVALRNGNSPKPSPRLIFPTSITGYTARSIDDNTSKEYRYMKEGEAGLFNKEVMKQNAPVFIVEGAIDALSILEVGGLSCAIGSTNSVDAFIKLLDRERPKAPLILSLDNDDAGQQAQNKLKRALEDRKLEYYEVNTAGEYKDQNEHLQKDRAAFTAIVANVSSDPAAQKEEIDRQAYLKSAAGFQVNAFFADIAERANTSTIPTGFKELDAALDGGLFEGLYIFGGLTSVGKTTFILQVADQIAQGGHDVMIFSLEMSRYELMAKSISRLTLDKCAGKTYNAKTTRSILDGTKWKDYSREELDLVHESMKQYSEYGQRIYIHEGIGDIGVKEIREVVEKHISTTGNTPVVFIDYLQILEPNEARATDKQNTDKAVRELKRLSRDKKIAVMAVSSFNRENYNSSVNLASFKESGAIEYSSDVLIGLQFAGMDEGKFDSARIEEMKKKDPREVEVKILKNRNGRTGISACYSYYPMFNAFYEEKDDKSERHELPVKII